MRKFISPVIWLCCVVLLLLYVSTELPNRQFNSSITAILPQNADKPWQQEIMQKNSSASHISLLLTGASLAELRQAAAAITLSDTSNISWYQPGKLMHTLQVQYQQHQGLMATTDAVEKLKQGQYQSLVDDAWRRLLSPAPLLSDALIKDPLLLTQQFIEQQGASAAWQLRDAWFELDNPNAILLHAKLAIDPFDNTQAKTVHQSLEQSISDIQSKYPQLEINRSGSLFHAVIAAQSASFEMQFYGGLSFVAILLLMVLCFYSIKPLLIATLVLTIASVTGVAAVLFFVPTPHILALVFATTLIGIAIDYSFHGMLGANKGERYFKKMMPSLTLGLLTTLLGYLTLTLLPFSLLNQVAIFMCAGLTAAFLTVWLFFPVLLKTGSLKNHALLGLAFSNVVVFYNRSSIKALSTVGITLAGLTLALLYKEANFVNDVRLFNQSPQSLINQEQQVRSLSNQQWDSRFIIVTGKTADHVLQKERDIINLLESFKAEGVIQGYQALSNQLPAVSAQDELQQLLVNAYQSEKVKNYLAELQLTPPLPEQKRLTPDNFESPMLAQLFNLDGQSASVILLSHSALSNEHIAQLTQFSDVYWLDPIGQTNDIFSALTKELIYWLVIASLVTLCLMVWRRGLKLGFAITLMLVISLCLALLVSQYVQQQLNIFNLVAALLVLALALDYGVFFTAKLSNADVYQAVLLSAFTSCLAFGLLAFSSTPAVASFGFTVFCGVALAALLAPFLTVLTEKESDTHGTL